MKFISIILILILSLFLETTFISLPFALLSIIFFAVIFREAWIFPAAFLSGILEDLLLFRQIGETSLFLILILGIIFLYQRKFEIQSLQFVVFFSFLSSITYGFIFSKQYVLWEGILSSLIISFIFILLSKINNVKPNLI